jgi:L-alanine-DL-glutamate epimerase-like enolase superfamily enzyme
MNLDQRRLVVEPWRLSLRDTFRIAREASDLRDNVLVRVRDASGLEGVGEAAPSPYYGQSAASVSDALQRLSWPADSDAFVLEDLLAALAPQLEGQSSALAALDMALHDLVGKRLGAPLHRLWGLNAAKAPLTSYTIGLASLDEIRRKTEQAAPYKILKVKLGGDQDKQIIATIRQVTDVPIRVDANAAWSVSEALENLRWLKDEGIELVEQPLPKDDLDGMAQVTEASPLPVIADESACTPRDVVKLAGRVHGINIKLAKCGGLREALKMIHIARAAGMQVMLGCFIESSVGITAAAQLSPLVDYADLDGHLLLAQDPARGVGVEEGRLVLPQGPGIGVELVQSQAKTK